MVEGFMINRYLLRYRFIVLTVLVLAAVPCSVFADDPCTVSDGNLNTLKQRVAEANSNSTTLCHAGIVLTGSHTYTLDAPLVFNNSNLADFVFEGAANSNVKIIGSLVFEGLGKSKSRLIKVGGFSMQSTGAPAVKVSNSSWVYIWGLSSVQVSGAPAIVFDNASGNYVVGSKIENSSSDGIQLLNGSNDNYFEQDILTGLSGHGVMIENSQNNYFTVMKLNRLGGSGFWLENAVKTTIGGWDLTEIASVAHGVYITGHSSGNVLDYVKISDFDLFGLALYDLGTSDTNAGNTFTKNTRIASTSSVQSQVYPAEGGIVYANDYFLSNIPLSSLSSTLKTWSKAGDGSYNFTIAVGGASDYVSKVSGVRLYSQDGTLLHVATVTTPSSTLVVNVPASQIAQPTTTVVYALLSIGDGQLINPSNTLTYNQVITGGSSGGEDAESGAYKGCTPSQSTTPIWTVSDGDDDGDNLPNATSTSESDILYASVNGTEYFTYTDFKLAGHTKDEAFASLYTIYQAEDKNRNCKLDDFSISLCASGTYDATQKKCATYESKTIYETDADYFDTDHDCISDYKERNNLYKGTDANATTVTNFGPRSTDTDGDQLYDGPVYGLSTVMTVTDCLQRAEAPDTNIIFEDTNLDGQWTSGTDKSSLMSGDTDGDELLDNQELQMGTNPALADTDNDGENDKKDGQPTNYDNSYSYDGCDPKVGYFSPTADSDGDGLLDVDEDANRNCVWDFGETSVLAPDTDADGLNDRLELSAKTNPLNPDTDGDGISDGIEDRARDKDGKDCERSNTDDSAQPVCESNGIVDADESSPLLVDTDSDGLSDSLEDSDRDGTWDDGETKAFMTGWNAQSGKPISDTDDDGIADGDEDKNHNGKIDTLETNPRKADTDGDQIADGVDCNPINPQQSVTCYADSYTNPDADADSDGLTNAQEDNNYNEVKESSDGNGRCDAGETCFSLADTDGDGIADGDERKFKYDPIKADSDADGLSDSQEDKNKDGVIGTGETDPNKADSDGDLIPDGIDPNPLLPAGQTDSDGDLLPDSIEDKNGNGFVDSGETDAKNADTDGDEISDGAEDYIHDGKFEPGSNASHTVETDPLNPDTDADGLDDGKEYRGNGYFSATQTNPNNPDTDGDGLTDGQEVLVYKTNPLLADSNSDGTADFDAALGLDTGGGGCSLTADIPTTPLSGHPVAAAASIILAAGWLTRHGIGRQLNKANKE